MTTTLLQQALQALEHAQNWLPSSGATLAECEDVAEKIAAHLAAAQPAPAEPVAHAQNPKDGFWVWCLADEPGAIPLYTHRAAQPAPVPAEPAAYLVEGWHDAKLIAHIPHLTAEDAKTSASVFSQHYTTVKTMPLYSAAPVPVPFTKAQLHRLYVNSPEHHKDAPSEAAFTRIVQLAEAAHGIAASPEVP